ncbi:MAG TPA: c-type cytochrome domain-containing protein [Haliangiales bacterium]|nr:c-type cytochrome domain-containing protein [Haliangiales bacterium]
MVRRVIAGALLVLAYGACGSDVDDRPATFTYIHAAILVPNCTTSGCHSAQAQIGGIVLEQREQSYVYLTLERFVLPGQLHNSPLLKLLRGREIWKMPPDQAIPEADIRLIEKWILAGAKDD